MPCIVHSRPSALLATTAEQNPVTYGQSLSYWRCQSVQFMRFFPLETDLILEHALQRIFESSQKTESLIPLGSIDETFVSLVF